MTNVSLSYPNFPHTIEIAVEVVELWANSSRSEYADAPADEANGLSWLIGIDGGPLLVTTMSHDPSRPFEKPIAIFRDTCEFVPSCVWDLTAHYHVEVGPDDDDLYPGAVRFNFADPDTALLFKLAFGGAR